MLHSVDCSGYMRLLWGYRNGVPLAPGPSDLALPRRAVSNAQSSMADSFDGSVRHENSLCTPTSNSCRETRSVAKWQPW